MAESLEGYKIKVVGEYIARSGTVNNEVIVKNYEVEGIIPSMERALSVVKNKLLAPLLMKKYPDYKAFRTYHIVHIVPMGPKAQAALKDIEIKYMDRKALLNYIRENALPVEERLYPNLFKLREAVEFAATDAKGYLKQLSLRKDDLLLDVQIAALNPDAFTEAVDVDEVAAIGASIQHIPAAKSSDPKQHAKKTAQRVDGLQKEMVKDGDIADI